jgi:succinyl-diaminopimelate desuccinylase
LVHVACAFNFSIRFANVIWESWFLIFALNIITLCGRIWKKSREVVTYKKELLCCDFLKNAGDFKVHNLHAKLESISNDLICAVQDAVKIRSLLTEPAEGMPFGPDVAKALEYALALASNMGFKTVNLDGYIGYAEYGEGEDYIAVLGHVDIVPEGSGWKYPPYGGEIHDSKLYGRGSVDDKGPIIAALYALKAIKDVGLPLSKRVRIIFGTDEETGCRDAEYYISKEKGPIAGFTPDGLFPVIYAEKGFLIISIVKEVENRDGGNIKLKHIKGGERPNMVPDYCEAILSTSHPADLLKVCEELIRRENSDIKVILKDREIHICAFGISAHGSTPELGVNAIMSLLACLEQCGLSGDIAEFITKINSCIGRETDGHSLGIALEDEPSGKLSCNVGTIEMNEEKVTLTCDIRFPVTFKSEEVIETLRQICKKLNFEIVCGGYGVPVYFPKEHPLIATLHRIFVEQSGLNVEPIAIGGGTYAKCIPNIVAYGPEFPGKPCCCHEANEYIEVEDLILSAKIYAQAIYELAR